MNPITLKSRIDTPTYRKKIHVIHEPESTFRKLVRKITKESRKKYEVESIPLFDPLKVTIIDEVDVMEWMQRAYSHDGREYKKEIQATDKDGTTYLFKGCFPINWVPATREATVSADLFEIVK